MTALGWYKILLVTEFLTVETLITLRFERRRLWGLRALIAVYFEPRILAQILAHEEIAETADKDEDVQIDEADDGRPGIDGGKVDDGVPVDVLMIGHREQNGEQGEDLIREVLDGVRHDRAEQPAFHRDLMYEHERRERRCEECEA